MPNSHSADIGDKIVIGSPLELDQAPTAYSISRRRTFADDELDWAVIFNEDGQDSYDPHFLKHYFETKWGAGEGVTPPTPDELFAAEHAREIYPTSAWPSKTFDATLGGHVGKLLACLPRVDMVEYDLVNEANSAPVDGDKRVRRGVSRLPRLKTTTKPSPDAFHLLSAGLVFCVPLDGNLARYYRPFKIVNEAKPITKEEFIQYGWNIVHGVEQVFGVVLRAQSAPDEASATAQQDADDGFSIMDPYRADAALIMRQWGYVSAHSDVAVAMTKAADELIKDGAPRPASMDGWQRLLSQYMELRKPLLEQRPKEAQLSGAAENLGYRLFLKDYAITVQRDGAPKPLKFDVKRGELYLEQLRQTSWTTWHTVRRKRRGWFGSRSTSFQIPLRHTKSYTYFQLVSEPGIENSDPKTPAKFVSGIDYDPWVEGATVYERAGFRVFLFLEQPDGSLATRDGESLVGVMDECERSETFRRKCVVCLPMYENTLIGKSLLAGYAFYVRPCRGLSVNEDPQIALQDTLTYRFAWTGTVLGELAASIPLAPGEEQEIMISRRDEIESSQSTVSRSLAELNTLDKRDFESVFENEVTKETSKETSGSVNASAPIGGGSIGGSASSKSSAKTIARTLNRSVKRASQEVNRKSRSETEITTTQRVTSNISNTASHKIRNINQGKTLNLNLYRLLNTHESGLYLDDLKVTAVAGVPLVEGTALRETRTFDLNQFDGEFGLLEFVRARAPVTIQNDSNDFYRFAIEFLKRLAKAAWSDYEEGTDGSDDPKHRLVWPVPGFAGEWRSGQGFVDDANEIARLRAEYHELICFFKGIRVPDFPERGVIVGRETFAVDSGSFYMDAVLGRKQATEEYAERMRRLEERAREADIEVTRAQAAAIVAEAADDIARNPHYLKDANYRVKAVSRKAQLTLTFSSSNLAGMEWDLFVLGRREPASLSISGDSMTYEFDNDRLDSLATWTQLQFHLGMYLRNRVTGQRVGYRYTQS